MSTRFLRRVAWITLCFFMMQTAAMAAEAPFFAPQVAISAAATSVGVVATAPTELYTSYLGVRSLKMRGNFGESFMWRYFTEGGDLSRNTRWFPLEPGTVTSGKDGVLRLAPLGRPSQNGLDGLFIQYDVKGNPKGLMVVESKFGSSQLGMTASGKQMSASWIRARLEQTAKLYKELAGLFKNGQIGRSSSPPPRGSKVTEIALDNKKSAQIWLDAKSGRYMYYSEVPLSGRELNKTAQYVDGAASGKISYKTRIMRFDVDKSGVFTLRIDNVDNAGGTFSSRTVEHISGKTYSQLSKNHQNMIREALEDAVFKELKHKGYSNEKASRLAKQVVDEAVAKGDRGVAELARQTYSPRLGLGLEVALKGGVFAAGVSFLFMTVYSFWKGEFSLENVVGMGISSLFAGAASSAGIWAGIQIAVRAAPLLDSFLSSTDSGPIKTTVIETLNRLGGTETISRVVGGVSGALITSAILAYGAAILGLSDWKTANRMMLTGTVSSVIIAGFTPVIEDIFRAAGTAAMLKLSQTTITTTVLTVGGSVAATVGGVVFTVVTGSVVSFVTVGLINALWRMRDRAEDRRWVEALVAGYR